MISSLLHHRCWLAAFLWVIAAQVASSAPHFGDLHIYRQPNGETFKVRLYGDEFFAYQETVDGFLVTRDSKSGFFCYAKVSSDGSEIISTGVKVGEKKPQGLQPKQRLAAGRAMHLSIKNRNLLGVDTRGLSNRGKNLMVAEDGDIMNVAQAGGVDEHGISPKNSDEGPISNVISGERVGLVLLAYFPDRPGDINKTVEDVDDFCNGENYTGDGNAVSVYKYFDIQSNGKLSYRCTVTAWFEAQHDRSYYTDPTAIFTRRAKELVNEGLEALKAQGYDFTQCDADGNGFLDGVNLFYAGARVNAWGEGLWPHKTSSSWQGLEGSGLLSTGFDYQIINMSTSLTIGGFCHESGHMICRFPDLYSYSRDNTGSAADLGNYSLMHGFEDAHPGHIDPYLKISAGWADVVDITSSSHLKCAVQQDRNFFYRYKNPSRDGECFLFEVRGDEGYEGPWGGAAQINPADGLVVYHALDTGSNTHSSIETLENPVDYSLPFQLMVVESNPATSAVPWYTDPTPGLDDAYDSAGVSSVSDNTTPGLKFWASDGRTLASGAEIHSISASGETMTFVCGSGAPPSNPITGITITQIDSRTAFGTDANSKTFAVFNQSGGSLSYSISDNAEWLSCSSTSGTATNEADMITVSFSTSDLAAGTYSATITVDGGSAGNETIPVTLTVNPQSKLTASTNSILLESLVGTQGTSGVFYVGSSTGIASYSLTKTQPWLSLHRTSGIVDSEQDLITISVNPTGLAPGDYTDTISIISADAGSSPVTVDVAFGVNSTDLFLTTPNGNEAWYINGSYNITWASSIGGNVKIELLKGGLLDTVIAANTANDGSHTWAIPSAQPLDSDYKIRVTSIENPGKTDQSLGALTIARDPVTQALDLPGYASRDSGNAKWFSQTITTHDGVSAAQSGRTSYNEESSMEITFTESGTLTFWWKIQSLENYDWLELYLNGALQAGSNQRITGNVDWVKRTVSIPSGTTTLKWTFRQGSYGSISAGWVDQVVFIPDSLGVYGVWAGNTFAKPFTGIDPSNNSDGDGLTNAQEFAFGTDPTTAHNPQLSYVAEGAVITPGLPILEGPAGGYKIVFARRKDHAAAGLTYIVEFSSDLAQWTNSTADLQVVTDMGSLGDYDAVSVPFPASVPLQTGGSDAPRFSRVKVSID